MLNRKDLIQLYGSVLPRCCVSALLGCIIGVSVKYVNNNIDGISFALYWQDGGVRAAALSLQRRARAAHATVAARKNHR